VYNHASPDSASLSVPKIGGLAISFDDVRRPAVLLGRLECDAVVPNDADSALYVYSEAIVT
jgi:hypothetical protein